MNETSVALAVRGAALRRWLPAVLALSYLLGFVWWTRSHFLDDAFIHLRYAEHFARAGIFSFNLPQPDHGASSALYVLILSVLPSQLLGLWSPKLVSVACLGLALVLLYQRDDDTRAGVGLREALVMLLLTPSALRWLTDGMETSMVVLALIALVRDWVRACDASPARNRAASLLATAALVMMAGLLRVELLVLGAMLAGSAAGFALMGPEHRPPTLRYAFAQGLGLALAVAIYLLLFGGITPDTAVAKAQGAAMGLAAQLRAVVTSLGGALSYGVGLGALSLAATILCLRQARAGISIGWDARRACALAVVLVLALIWTLILLRGQRIEGIRHVHWLLLLPVLVQIECASAPRLSRLRPVHLGLAWLVLCTADLAVLRPVFELRSDAVERMERSAQIHALSGRSGAAYDVGAISYFAQARITDLNGLVNGPEAARRSREQRLAALEGPRLDFLFLTPAQEADVARQIDLRCFEVHERFLFRNVSPATPGHTLYRRRAGCTT